MSFEYALKKALLKEMEFEVTEHEDATEDDPFLLMGYGINAYFDLIISLMKFCFVITIFCIPLYIAFCGYAFPSVSLEALKHEQKYLIN